MILLSVTKKPNTYYISIIPFADTVNNAGIALYEMCVPHSGTMWYDCRKVLVTKRDGDLCQTM